jgi:hypothetical protein
MVKVEQVSTMGAGKEALAVSMVRIISRETVVSAVIPSIN